ncbi:KR domain-containing protein [Kutzneria kofuensis]|uniref:KR domain-containing protein n=1 Tax=Kutzneria kofuensis TaxID=103725 RepID=UPI0031E7FA4F
MLLTGGTGGLGVLFARHLLNEHGVRKLLITSRAAWTPPVLRNSRRSWATR